jgi:hypothetical protein
MSDDSKDKDWAPESSERLGGPIVTEPKIDPVLEALAYLATNKPDELKKWIAECVTSKAPVRDELLIASNPRCGAGPELDPIGKELNAAGQPIGGPDEDKRAEAWRTLWTLAEQEDRRVAEARAAGKAYIGEPRLRLWKSRVLAQLKDSEDPYTERAKLIGRLQAGNKQSMHESMFVIAVLIEQLRQEGYKLKDAAKNARLWFEDAAIASESYGDDYWMNAYKTIVRRMGRSALKAEARLFNIRPPASMSIRTKQEQVNVVPEAEKPVTVSTETLRKVRQKARSDFISEARQKALNKHAVYERDAREKAQEKAQKKHSDLVAKDGLPRDADEKAWIERETEELMRLKAAERNS